MSAPRPRSVRELLGRVVTLPIRRFGSPGAFLAIDPSDARPNAPLLLLLGPEIPEGASEGDELEVFVYQDSEDRPIATTRSPMLVLHDRDRGKDPDAPQDPREGDRDEHPRDPDAPGDEARDEERASEVTFLTVTDVTAFGAFVDWGMPKELLVPLGEQTREMRVGDRHPIGLYIDDSGRLAGTMRVSELLRDRGDFELDEWVEGEAWREEPGLGVFVIVERAFVGLLPATEPHPLRRGMAARFRVTRVHPDGKIELSLRGAAHEELEGDAQRLLGLLSRLAPPRVGDHSSPEEIRTVTGLSKKAFKRAAGRLLKLRSVEIDPEGFLLVARAAVKPTE